MPKKKYIVSLTPEERQKLEQLTKTGKAPAYKVNHARILLKADINQVKGGWTDRASWRVIRYGSCHDLLSETKICRRRA